MPLLSPEEVLAETVSIVPWVHIPVGNGARILTIGYEASSAALLALRFPEAKDVVIVGAPGPSDSRVRTFGTVQELPIAWTPDLAVITVPTITPDLLHSIQLSPKGIACLVLGQFADVVPVRTLARTLWRYITVYREYVGGEPVLCIMGSNAPIARQRAVPGISKRYTDKYLPNLFTFAKDEFQSIFGAG